MNADFLRHIISLRPFRKSRLVLTGGLPSGISPFGPISSSIANGNIPRVAALRIAIGQNTLSRLRFGPQQIQSEADVNTARQSP
jgi:hypothetical protein